MKEPLAQENELAPLSSAGNDSTLHVVAACTLAEMVVDPPAAFTFGGAAVNAVITGVFPALAPDSALRSESTPDDGQRCRQCCTQQSAPYRHGASPPIRRRTVAVAVRRALWLPYECQGMIGKCSRALQRVAATHPGA